MTKEELAKRVAELSAPACATDPTETCRCSGNVLRIVADQRDRALALLRDAPASAFWRCLRLSTGEPGEGCSHTDAGGEMCEEHQRRALLAEVGYE